MRLDIQHEFTLPVPRATAWRLLQDVRELTKCVPGTDEVAVVEADRRYEGTIAERVGPFRVRVRLLATVEEREEPRYLRVTIVGEDRASRTRADGTLQATLQGAPDGPTSMKLGVVVDVTGPLTTLGAPVVRRRGAEILAQFADCAATTLVGGAGTSTAAQAAPP